MYIASCLLRKVERKAPLNTVLNHLKITAVLKRVAIGFHVNFFPDKSFCSSIVSCYHSVIIMLTKLEQEIQDDMSSPISLNHSLLISPASLSRLFHIFKTGYQTANVHAGSKQFDVDCCLQKWGDEGCKNSSN